MFIADERQTPVALVHAERSPSVGGLGGYSIFDKEQFISAVIDKINQDPRFENFRNIDFYCLAEGGCGTRSPTYIIGGASLASEHIEGKELVELLQKTDIPRLCLDKLSFVCGFHIKNPSEVHLGEGILYNRIRYSPSF